jgi:oligopeptide/dipeptide ABC transporter ATP-binding protein
MLFITHDLGVIAQLVDRVAVMYAGQIVETAPVGELFGAPGHHYTRGLIDCMPARAKVRRLRAIPGQAPRPGAITAGCVFAPRCAQAQDVCRAGSPPRVYISERHEAVCAFPVSQGRPL